MRGVRRLPIAAIAAPGLGRLARADQYQSRMNFGVQVLDALPIFPPLRLVD